jgi:hypothetical protein
MAFSVGRSLSNILRVQTLNEYSKRGTRNKMRGIHLFQFLTLKQKNLLIQVHSLCAISLTSSVISKNLSSFRLHNVCRPATNRCNILKKHSHILIDGRCNPAGCSIIAVASEVSSKGTDAMQLGYSELSSEVLKLFSNLESSILLAHIVM